MPVLLYKNKVTTGQDMVSKSNFQGQEKLGKSRKIKNFKKVRKNCSHNAADLLTLRAGKTFQMIGISAMFFLNEALRLSFSR